MSGPVRRFGAPFPNTELMAEARGRTFGDENSFSGDFPVILPVVVLRVSVWRHGRWVVLCSERRGNPDLYALDLKNGGQPRLLTDNDSMEDAPAFSPDGRRIVFVSTRDGSADIFTMQFDSDDPKASSLRADGLARDQ